ncbi:MAG TPA: GxGYxYP domain-containing protein [Verrucomicrobiae bacterium]
MFSLVPGLVCAAGGLFPKMPLATNVFVVNCQNDSEEAKRTELALQGLVNRTSAEVYLVEKPLDRTHLEDSGIAHVNLPLPNGNDAGLCALFQKYQSRVKKMILYDPAKDWTFHLAVMAGAQENGIPVTEPVKDELVSKSGWSGEIEDYRNRWPDKITAYDWAMQNLMPHCNRQVVFALKSAHSLIDYAVATGGFDFHFDLKANPGQRDEMDKIFHAGGYTVGSSLMGYDRDSANVAANKYGIGYVVSDLYDNGSFWSSQPDETFHQAPGRAIAALPGRVYVTITWSDGDNIQFDQNAIYQLWKDPARGSVPVGTTLSPSLQELDPKLLDWYYKKMTANDELMAGPSGVQFIYGNDFNDQLFPAWCATNRIWLADAGFHTACLWHTAYPGQKFSSYLSTCGLDGILFSGDITAASAGQAHEHSKAKNRHGSTSDVVVENGIPVISEGHAVWNEDDIFNHLSRVQPDPDKPVFVGVKCIVEGFEKKEGAGGGYAKIKRQVDRLNAAYPGRFVFLLPKDLFATIRTYTASSR